MYYIMYNVTGCASTFKSPIFGCFFFLELCNRCYVFFFTAIIENNFGDLHHVEVFVLTGFKGVVVLVYIIFCKNFDCFARRKAGFPSIANDLNTRKNCLELHNRQSSL
jgi:hypothetical protein